MQYRVETDRDSVVLVEVMLGDLWYPIVFEVGTDPLVGLSKLVDDSDTVEVL